MTTETTTETTTYTYEDDIHLRDSMTLGDLRDLIERLTSVGEITRQDDRFLRVKLEAKSIWALRDQLEELRDMLTSFFALDINLDENRVRFTPNVGYDALVGAIADAQWQQPRSNSEKSCPFCEMYRDTEADNDGHDFECIVVRLGITRHNGRKGH